MKQNQFTMVRDTSPKMLADEHIKQIMKPLSGDKYMISLNGGDVSYLLDWWISDKNILDDQLFNVNISSYGYNDRMSYTSLKKLFNKQKCMSAQMTLDTHKLLLTFDDDQRFTIVTINKTKFIMDTDV